MSPSPTIAVVGLGPRGISVIERLAAQLPAGTRLTLRLIDDAQHGAGRVWNTEQSRTMCMNTLSGAATLFTEPGSSVEAPVVEGPTLHEWIRHLRGEEIEGPRARLLAEHPPQAEVAAAFAAEAAVTRPDSHPTRALYGAYLRWVFDVALARLPESVTVVRHDARVTDLRDTGADSDELTLSDGSTVLADATVLALGWQTPGLTAAEQEIADSGHTWLRPGNPVDQGVHRVPESGTVLVRGLGMGFFDTMALLTLDRGGRFVEDPTTRSGLRYEPSGREPHLVATSFRGYPYLPKPVFGSLGPRTPRRHLKKAMAELRGAARICFDTQVWPAVVADTYEAYYRTLARVRPGSVHLDADDFAAALEELLLAGGITGDLGGVDKLMEQHTSEPFTLRTYTEPLAGFRGTRAELTAHLGERMAADIRDALDGADSPVKAALWSINASRKLVSVLGAEDRYTRESRDGLYATMVSLGQMVGSGPPLFRSRQLLALVDAGLVSFLGAAPQIRVGAEGFTATSASVHEEVHSDVLIDAWMYNPDVRRPADPLLLSLLDAARARPYALTAADGTPAPGPSPEVHPASRLLIGADGEPDPRVMLLGIPTWGQMPDTFISPMPGTDPLLLQETDKASRTALRVALGARVPA